MAIDADGDFVVVWQSSDQDGSATASSPSASTPRARPGGRVPGQHLHHELQVCRAVARRRRRRLRGGLESSGQDGSSARGLRPPLPSAGVPRRRVPGQHLHHELLRPSPSRGRRQRRLRRHLAERAQDGSERRHLRSALLEPPAHRSAREFQVNTYTHDDPVRVRHRSDADGDFVIAWSSELRPGRPGTGVFAQRFPAAAHPRHRRQRRPEPLTDGLLVLRFLFGFTGNALAGAVGSGCTRCDARHDRAATSRPRPVLDIDSNGGPTRSPTACSILRFLFGFTGRALINDAVAGNAAAATPARSRPTSPGPGLSRTTRYRPITAALAASPSSRDAPRRAGRRP